MKMLRANKTKATKTREFEGTKELEKKKKRKKYP